MNEIKITPIGIIHTPYNEPKHIPIQGKFKKDIEGFVELDEKYVPGLKDLEGFSHAILIYYFHRSQTEHIQGQPFLENETHGIFAIRSPHRPNHVGFSVVRIKKNSGNKLIFTEVDMLNGTPLIDIKPYCKHYDCRDDAISGWVDKHFTNGNIPEKTILS